MKNRKYLYKLVPIYCGILALFLVAAVCGSNVATFTIENQRVDQNHCIVIDAGHGSPDGGATSCTGALESDINLQIAKRLDDLLHLLGFRTIMVRNDEMSIFTEGHSIAAKKVSDIRNRVALINSVKGGLLISIHQNYFSDGRYSGAQVFYARTEGSKDLGVKLQTSLAQYLAPDNNRQSKKVTGVYLMDKITCTGVLVECGFLSNPEEAVRLQEGAYQKKLCSVIGTTIGSYLNTLTTTT